MTGPPDPPAVGDGSGPHGSGLRDLLAGASGIPYVAFASLDDARMVDDGFVVLEGDWGGQVYAVFPAASVRCDEAVLEQLLRDVDALAWPGDEAGARLVFERCAPGSGIAGGMGGAVAAIDGWVHADLGVALEAQIREVVAGRRARVEPSGDA